MLLQTIRSGTSHDIVVLSQTRWRDEVPHTGGLYRGRLQQCLGGFFEKNAETLRPKRELTAATVGTIPDAVRLLDDQGQIVASYSTRDLACDTGLTLDTTN